VSLLEKGGLVLPGSRPGEYRDRFRGRVIFPIFSLTGRVVGFGGRTIVDAEPKYLNSPETPLYSKGKLLYGLNFTKDAVRREGTAILVEGYTDFSSLYQAGFTNVVASLGTALTAWQVGQVMRFAQRLVINYDGDTAGRTAMARAVPIGFEKGLNVEVLVLPDGLDPDAYLKKHGRDKYQALLKKTVSGLDFLIDAMTAGARMSVPEEKGKVAHAVVREIEKVPDPVARSEYLRRASSKLGVGEELLRSLVGRKGPDKAADEPGLFCPAEKRLFQILMTDRAIAHEIFAECGGEIFQGLRGEQVFQHIMAGFKNDEDWSFPSLQGKVPPALLSQLATALFEKASAGTVEEAQECLRSLRRVHLQNRLKTIQRDIARTEKAGEKEELLALLYQKQDVTKQILSLQ